MRSLYRIAVVRCSGMKVADFGELAWHGTTITLGAEIFSEWLAFLFFELRGLDEQRGRVPLFGWWYSGVRDGADKERLAVRVGAFDAGG
jgi:hypothetical protein